MKLKIFGKELSWGEKPQEQKVVDNNLSIYPVFESYIQDFLGLSNKGEEQLLSYKSWVYACVSKTAKSVADINLELYKKNGQDRDQVETHEILDLLHGVNPYITFYDLVEMTQVYQELAGEAFWWLMKDGTGKPIQIVPFLRPDYMKTVPDAKDFIKGYLYRVPNSADEIAFERDEIIHFKNFNPTDFYKGYSPVMAGDIAIETHKELGWWNFNFFKNNATPKGMLMSESKIPKDTMERIQEAWESKHRGTSNAHKLAVISGKALSFQEVGMSIKDMDFSTLKDKTRDEILAMFQMPKSVLGLTDDVNRASAEATIAVWKEETIVPKMKKFVNVLNEHLVKQFSEDLFLDFENPVPRDVNSDLTFYKELFSIGALTPNEIRTYEGLEPVAGGDTLYIPTMMTPLGMQDLTATAEDSGGLKRAKKVHFIHPKAQTKNEKIKKIIGDTIREKAKLLLKKRRKSIKKKDGREAIEQLIREAKDQKKQLFWKNVWEIKVSNTAIDERRMKSLLLPEFRRQEKQVLASLNQKDFGFSFDLDVESKKIEKKVKPFIKEVVVEYGLDAAALVGGDTFDVNSRVRDFLKGEGLQFVEDINKTTIDKIKNSLAQSVSDGDSMEEAAGRLKQVFGELKTSRAEMIARTEIARADGFATVESFKQTGIEQKEWFAEPDAPDADCTDTHGEVVGIDDDFSNGVSAEPVHPNCRCIVLPVTGKDVNFELLGIKMQKLKDRISKETQDIYDNAEKVVHQTEKMMRDTQDKLESLLQEDGQAETTEKPE